MSKIRLGPPRHYAPLCIQHWHGFSGGPTAYREVDAGHYGPIVIHHTQCRYGGCDGEEQSETGDAV